MDSIFACEGITKSFGAFKALHDVSFKVFAGQVFGIAGPNGAGKSTLFNVITNVPYPPSSGRIIFKGVRIDNLPAYKICRLGISRTWQIPSYFKSMSILENLKVGYTFGRVTIDSPKDDQELMNVLDFVGLKEKRDIIAEKLSLFDRKCLMLGSALAVKPMLLLLDEPLGGLNMEEIEAIKKLIVQIKHQGIAILLIEHIMAALTRISDHLMILDFGEKIVEGTPSDVCKDDRVIKAYLGEKFRDTA